MRKIWLLAPASALVLAGCGVSGNLNATPQGHNNYNISGHVHLTPPSTVPSESPSPSSSAQTAPSVPPSHSEAPKPSPTPQPTPSHSTTPPASPTQSASPPPSASSGQGSNGCGPACGNHSQQTTPPSEPATTGVSWSHITLNDSGGPANPLAVQISVAVPSTFSNGPSYWQGPYQLVTESIGSPQGYHDEPPSFFAVTLSQYPRKDLKKTRFPAFTIPGGLQPGPLGNGSYQTVEDFGGAFGDAVTVYMPHLPNGNVGTVEIVVPQNHAAWLQVMLQSIKVYS